MAKIVIIGAGLTGLSAAYHLEKKGFYNYKIFEKELEIGGLCRSVNQDGFTFDFTGHLLHINDTYTNSLIKKLIGLENFNKLTRQSFIYSHEKHTPYPYQGNLFGLPTKVIIDCIEGFVLRKKKPQRRKIIISGYSKISALDSENIFSSPIKRRFLIMTSENYLKIGQADLSLKQR